MCATFFNLYNNNYTYVIIVLFSQLFVMLLTCFPEALHLQTMTVLFIRNATSRKADRITTTCRLLSLAFYSPTQQSDILKVEECSCTLLPLNFCLCIVYTLLFVHCVPIVVCVLCTHCLMLRSLTFRYLSFAYCFNVK